jgi:hypothetical protein
LEIGPATWPSVASCVVERKNKKLFREHEAPCQDQQCTATDRYLILAGAEPAAISAPFADFLTTYQDWKPLVDRLLSISFDFIVSNSSGHFSYEDRSSASSRRYSEDDFAAESAYTDGLKGFRPGFGPSLSRERLVFHAQFDLHRF